MKDMSNKFHGINLNFFIDFLSILAIGLIAWEQAHNVWFQEKV